MSISVWVKKISRVFQLQAAFESLTTPSFLPPEVILLGGMSRFLLSFLCFLIGKVFFVVMRSRVTAYQAEQFSTRETGQRNKEGSVTMLFQSPCCCHLCSVLSLSSRDCFRLNRVPSPSPWPLSSRIMPSPCGSITLRWYFNIFLFTSVTN